MAELSLVIFDVDGTLIDGEAQVSDTMATAFEAAGLPPPDRAAVSGVIGLSLPEMVSALLGPDRADRFEKVVASYRFYFAAAIANEEDPPVYDGAESALQRLHGAGLALGIATGKSAMGLGHALDALDWHRFFVTTQCADDNPSKPDPAMLHKALAEADMPADRAVFVGDTTFDMQMAAAAGVRAIGVGWGYQPAQRLYDVGADAVVLDFRALTDLLLEGP